MILLFRDTDVYIEKESLPFHRSTPRPSLEPDRMKNSNDFLDSSNLSPTSFIANTKDNSIGQFKIEFKMILRNLNQFFIYLFLF